MQWITLRNEKVSSIALMKWFLCQWFQLDEEIGTIITLGKNATLDRTRICSAPPVIGDREWISAPLDGCNSSLSGVDIILGEDRIGFIIECHPFDIMFYPISANDRFSRPNIESNLPVVADQILLE